MTTRKVLLFIAISLAPALLVFLGVSVFTDSEIMGVTCIVRAVDIFIPIALIVLFLVFLFGFGSVFFWQKESVEQRNRYALMFWSSSIFVSLVLYWGTYGLFARWCGTGMLLMPQPLPPGLTAIVHY